jgi:acyl-CoA thioesterase II
MTEPTGSLGLLALLTVEPLDRDLYRAMNPDDGTRPTLYGGQVAAQALRAAADTVEPDRLPHSLHGYFLRAGRPDRPTIITVDRDRDGGSFSARHVNAVQGGEVIFSALASFHREEEGVDFQAVALPDDAGDPEALADAQQAGHHVLFEMRYPPQPGVAPDEKWRLGRIWVRPRAAIPDDPVIRACLLVYMSDMGWAFDAVVRDANVGGPSLDHAVWLQRPIDVNDWMLLHLMPMTTARARGVFTATIHDRAGTLAAWITQEALLRRRSSG